ncbi:hypothetical protein QF043_005847 [Pseudomonas sp. W3I7]|uniref:hypothetical protein n=1 Tax=Pseudomonas sp. W3I7 TaxID=3042292 RepID=UPI0027929789|nr:hypothetical protein [Pseudomonas sp. W3I7]MDQ0707055.1 hypothetical protein [Pseudomonas sp. W3I7]
MIRLHGAIKGFSQAVAGKEGLQGDIGIFMGFISQPWGKKKGLKNEPSGPQKVRGV